MAGDDLQCQTKEKCSDEKEIEKNLKCTEWKLQENRKPQCRIWYNKNIYTVLAL